MGMIIPLSKMVLIDTWPGVPRFDLGVPTGGFDSTMWNFSTADHTVYALNPPYSPGTKIQAYTDNTECPGNYTMIYLARHEFSEECISADFSDGQIFCGPLGLLEITRTALESTQYPWVVQQCYTGKIGEGSCFGPTRLCIACTTTDADSSRSMGTAPDAIGYGHAWGWFWCGGVCPCKDITILQGTRGSLAGAEITAQDSTVTKGFIWACWTSTSKAYITQDVSSDMNSAILGPPEPFAWICVSARTV